MNEPLATVDASTAPAQFGRQLAAARESNGLSVADVARQLRLSTSQVEAIEAGDYERLPGPVFARGFIRNYARLVKLDCEELLASSGQRLHSTTEVEPEIPRSVNIPFPTGHEFNWRRYIVAAPLLLVLLVPVVIYEIYREDTPDATPRTGAVVLPGPQADVREPVAAGPTPQVAAVVDTELKPALTMDATGLSATPVATGAALPADAAVTALKPGEHLIQFTFDKDSWVEIHDRAGRRIFSRLNAAGTEQQVSGEAPLTLVVGNARGVRLTYDGRLVDLAPHTNVAVARLTLE